MNTLPHNNKIYATLLAILKKEEMIQASQTGDKVKEKKALQDLNMTLSYLQNFQKRKTFDDCEEEVIQTLNTGAAKKIPKLYH